MCRLAAAVRDISAGSRAARERRAETTIRCRARFDQNQKLGFRKERSCVERSARQWSITRYAHLVVDAARGGPRQSTKDPSLKKNTYLNAHARHQHRVAYRFLDQAYSLSELFAID
jgi:hypothetical protein